MDGVNLTMREVESIKEIIHSIKIDITGNVEILSESKMAKLIYNELVVVRRLRRRPKLL